ncbi:hypothetical protein C4572_04080 [Candidatus Parcubacteria bacterium]|nr:MAG: hypothetical protein C4572_04080 [Candidatus Parcubacteria bacterium]
MHDIVQSLSGIRGDTRISLNPDLCRRYGFAYGKILKEESVDIKGAIVVGGDSRPSYGPLVKALVEGISGAGWKKIINVGISPTPAVQFAVRFFKARGGCIVTGSHTEPQFNGLKFLDRDGGMIRKKTFDKLIENLPEIFKFANPKPVWKDQAEKTKEGYINYLVRLIGEENIESVKNAKFKVVFDPNGGAASEYLVLLAKKLGLKHKIINGRLGAFNRVIEPTPGALEKLLAGVDEDKADLGFAFDCDADRVEMVLPSGERYSRENSPFVDGQYVLSLLVDDVLSRDKTAHLKSIVVNDATSTVVHEVAKKHGAKVIEVETGEINVVEEMERQNSPVGGEGSSSGGIFPPSKCRDGFLTMAMILRMAAVRKMSLSDILLTYPKIFTVREKLDCPHDSQLVARLRLHDFFLQNGYRVKTSGGPTGGLKVFFSETSFVWFRASKTEAGKFRVFAESRDAEESKRLLALAIERFNKIVSKGE